MSLDEFQSLVAGITAEISGKVLDDALARDLATRFPPEGEAFQALNLACLQGITEGWLCQHEAGGVQYGRAIKPGPATHGFSVDVVRMQDLKGPHHRHPNGEIDMVMPVTKGARFDGHGAGWCVYGPGTAHHPTVTEGEAVVLYLLPDGAIEFTKT